MLNVTTAISSAAQTAVQQAAGQANAPQPTEIERAIQSLKDLFGGFASNNGRLQTIKDRAFGEQPQSEKDASRPVAPGQLGALDEELQKLNELLDFQNRIINDLTRIV